MRGPRRVAARSREANMAQRIGIAGITGRMGQLLAEEVPTAGAVLSGGAARPGEGEAGGGTGGQAGSRAAGRIRWAA